MEDYVIKTVHYLWLKVFPLNYKSFTIRPSKSNQEVESSCLRFDIRTVHYLFKVSSLNSRSITFGSSKLKLEIPEPRSQSILKLNKFTSFVSKCVSFELQKGYNWPNRHLPQMFFVAINVGGWPDRQLSSSLNHDSIGNSSTVLMFKKTKCFELW